MIEARLKRDQPHREVERTLKDSKDRGLIVGYYEGKESYRKSGDEKRRI